MADLINSLRDLAAKTLEERGATSSQTAFLVPVHEEAAGVGMGELFKEGRADRRWVDDTDFMKQGYAYWLRETPREAPGFRIITTAPNMIETENATEVKVDDFNVAREAFDHRVAMAIQHAEYGTVTVIDERPDRHNGADRVVLAYDRRGVHSEMIRRLRDLVAMNSNLVGPYDVREVNSRGGNGDEWAAKAGGKEEIAEELAEILKEFGFAPETR